MKSLLTNLLASILLISAGLSINGCNSQDKQWKKDLNADLSALSNQYLVDNKVDIKNSILKVKVPSKNYEWNQAWGDANADPKTLATSKDQFYVASIGKTTLATLTMLFVEQGKISLDDPIKQYLPETVMTGLHTYNGVDYSGKITIKQLLNHTSGLQDYFTDGDENSNSLPDFFEVLFSQQDKIWEPIETIDYVKTNLPALFPPGTEYHYTDTEYVLMGMILENITEMDLARIYREKLWEPLNMDNTYFFFRETAIPPNAGASFAHAYFAELNVTETNILSSDWAGGGIISSSEDLYKFMHAWVNNDIFKKAGTKKLMTNYNPVSNYGLGIARLKPAGYEGTLVGHDGANQSVMYYIPEYDAYIIGTFNQVNEDDAINIDGFVKKAIALLKKHIKQKDSF